MASGRFSEVDVGLQANAFEVADLFGRHDVVEILGHGVGIEAHAGTDDLRCAEPQAADGIARAVDQVFCEFAGLDLLSELFLIDGVENVVEIGEQGAEC